MHEMIAQIVLEPATVNILLGGIIALQGWLVRRTYILERRVSLIQQSLSACKCLIGLRLPINDLDDD